MTLVSNRCPLVCAANTLLGVFFCDFRLSYSSGDWAVFPTLHGDSSTLPGYTSVLRLIGQDAPGNWGSISITT